MNIEKLEHNMAKITIEVSVEDFDKAVDKAYQKQKGQISIPGFRKGKVPRAMVEKMYGKEVFFEEAANICIPEAYEKAYDEIEEEIVSQPKIDVVQIEAGKPFIFTAEVALKPEVTLGDYKGVEIDKIDATVTDEDIEADIKSALEAQARQVSVERAAKDGDLVVLDFEGFVDGVAFEGGKGENYNLTLGSGSFIPGFEDQLVGKNVDEECEVNVTFPEDYQAEELAGKAAVFKCVIHEIKEKQIPELDEDFIDDAGFDSVDAYKADVKAKLEEKKTSEAKSAKEEAAIMAVVEKATMDIPEAMVETQVNRMINDFAQQLSMQGLSLEQYFMFTGMTKEQFAEQTRPRAEKSIQSRLVLEAVAAAEGFTASDEELEAELKEMADAYKMEVAQIKELLPATEMDGLKKDICVKKAIDVIANNAVEK
ncbi:MAG: trigger factor [Lachnospiraceae bacterium]|nr:trigger factor [Lachnospiraceae bacterium]